MAPASVKILNCNKLQGLRDGNVTVECYSPHPVGQTLKATQTLVRYSGALWARGLTGGLDDPSVKTAFGSPRSTLRSTETLCLTADMSMSIFGPAVGSRTAVFSPYTGGFAGGWIALTLKKCQGYLRPLGSRQETRARLHGVAAAPIERRTDAGLDRPIGSSGTPEFVPFQESCDVPDVRGTQCRRGRFCA
jgi:hypothetical protein